MRAGLLPGTRARVDAVVTPDMVATLGGSAVHPLLATAKMIEWMEWAGRRLILPFLEPEEDAVGYAIDVVHLRPTRVGEAFWAIATFLTRDGNRLLARVEAFNAGGLIGRGQFTQVLVARRDLERWASPPPTVDHEIP
jgi:predicted thioesterase